MSFAPAVKETFGLVGPLPDQLPLPPSTNSDSTQSTNISKNRRHGRKRDSNHITRPPNKFILYRSWFIRNRVISTRIETNHSKLSKIIGKSWRDLPEQEKQEWDSKARAVNAEHMQKFPKYVFSPQKPKKKKVQKRNVVPKDTERCVKIAQYLTEGKKGSDLETAVEIFDRSRVPTIRFNEPITACTFRPALNSTDPPHNPNELFPKEYELSVTTSRQATPSVEPLPRLNLEFELVPNLKETNIALSDEIWSDLALYVGVTFSHRDGDK
jgi:hypothetical protein